MPEIKKIQLRSDDNIQNKILAKYSSLGVFDEVSVSKFKRGLCLEGYALDCIAGLKKDKNCFKPYYQ